ncbi:uncharacterized protein EURHEDRAFT_288242 [Aspergillus ruber CBS 135680]|uniref:Uncharacterized protein n=1 Tax=Aspergillus ruber (strain CBS 135680) TaxID=1388766 RepID=A0A017S1Y4_ASPRC|nr:uncharacterized protein EURHEDRAFT_288242 [Aspergillus ruber CBS 135680]EYE90634.1 hypothetical protein EURHEDRAFT_288242 [Aspergillus ruber CBS 135680]
MCENQATNAGMTLDPGRTWHSAQSLTPQLYRSSMSHRIDHDHGLSLRSACVQEQWWLVGVCQRPARTAKQQPIWTRNQSDGTRVYSEGRSDRAIEEGMEGWGVGRKMRWWEDGQTRRTESVKADGNLIRFAVAGKIQLIGSRIDEVAPVVFNVLVVEG